MSEKYVLKKAWKKIWHFIWEEDSLASWIVNILLAFILIKFIVYPGLGFILSTSHPVVAVVSGSMEHNGLGFDEWWEENEAWYSDIEMAKDDFVNFHFRNGFNKGDIMVLQGKDSSEIKLGEVIVFVSSKQRPRADPIIHRVVKIEEKDGKYTFKTKGDNNPDSINGCDVMGCLYEGDISQEQVIGKALFRIPLLGYIKIWAVEILRFVINIFR